MKIVVAAIGIALLMYGAVLPGLTPGIYFCFAGGLLVGFSVE